MRWSYEWASTFAIVVKVSYEVPSIQNEAPYQRRYRRRATRWRINRRSREGRNEVPAANQSPTRSMGLQEVWVRTESTNLHTTFRTNLALEKGRSCVKSGRRGSWRYANFGRWSTSEAALTRSMGYGWTGQQPSSGFCDLAPSILHYNWF